VFALQPLYDQDDPCEIPPASKKAKRANYYGPEDNNKEDPNNDSELNDNSSGKWWDIEVKIQNEEDEPFLKRQFFIVRFFFAAKVALHSDVGKLIVAAEDKFRVLNFINMGIKNSMIDAGFRSFDKDKHFVPTNLELHSHLMSEVRHRSPYVAPVTGLSETAHMSVDDKLYVMANFCMKWANKKVRVLNGQQQSILGVQIDLRRLPLSEEKLKAIYVELKKISFHINYDKGQQWVDRMKAKDKSDEWINRCRFFTKGGTCRVFKSPNKQMNEELLPTAESISFKKMGSDGNEVDISVRSHYEAKGVNLQYPNLPIVRVSKQEWFPIEFLIQGMSTVDEVLVMIRYFSHDSFV
jgi:hypothetical protein